MAIQNLSGRCCPPPPRTMVPKLRGHGLRLPLTMGGARENWPSFPAFGGWAG